MTAAPRLVVSTPFVLCALAQLGSAQQIAPVSLDSAGVARGGANPVVSADGRYVAFVSGATNLVNGDTNQSDDVFVRDRRGLHDHEVEALESYARDVGISSDVARAIDAIYPVLVGAMAEKNWDYSRPRWLHRQFGV